MIGAFISVFALMAMPPRLPAYSVSHGWRLVCGQQAGSIWFDVHGAATRSFSSFRFATRLLVVACIVACRNGPKMINERPSPSSLPARDGSGADRRAIQQGIDCSRRRAVNGYLRRLS